VTVATAAAFTPWRWRRATAAGVREMRIHVGAGYRICFARTGNIVLLLLCGCDKSSQVRDIARAKRLLTEPVKE